MSLDKRIDAEREFFEHSPSILVATEAAGEGINLQFCSLMVNYDIPWNPNRLEQRMGRIHRYKQKHEVMIFNLVARTLVRARSWSGCCDKLEDMREALGSDRVYDVIGEIIPAPRFDALMKDWLSKRRTMTEILAEIELQTDERQVARIRADMEDKALGSRYIDMSSLAQMVQQSKEQRLMPEYIERFFVEAYRSFGGTIAPVKDQKGSGRSAECRPTFASCPRPMERRYGKIGQALPEADLRQGTAGPATPTWSSSAPATRSSRASSSGSCGSTARRCVRGPSSTTPTPRSRPSSGCSSAASRTARGSRSASGSSPSTTRRAASARASPTPCSTSRPPSPLPALPDDRQGGATGEDEIIEWSLDEVVAPYFGEIEDRRKKELAIKEKYVRKSLQFLISESNKKIAKYDQPAAADCRS